jgi:anti-sigma regulatory factor (Ser/Thr protein kinase)
MAPHQVFDVQEASQVGEARRVAVVLAGRLGLDETSCGRLALVATELGTNLVRHAVGGQLLVAQRDGPAGASIEILSLDRGPGMADLDRCLRDGYSTSSTPGTGFGAVRRLAEEFAAFSCAPGGTVVLARVGHRKRTRPAAPAPRFQHASISVAATGETKCGDAWSLVQRGGRAAVLMVDGLGHGPEAERAALACVTAFEAAAFDAPDVSLARAHAAMRATRGAAAAIAQLDIDAETVSFCGVGNIAARLASGIENRSFLCQHGTLGLQIGRLQAVDVDWPEHALFVMHSDGIPTRWDLRKAPGLFQSDPAVIAGWLIRDHLGGRDDATVVVVRVAARESA